MDATIRVTGVQLKNIAPQIQKALDTALAGTLNLQQGSLAKACPKDTGRMASSFFVGQNQPVTDSRDENWGQPGDKRLEIEEYNGEITFEGDWYISNAVPYAQYVAYNYKPGATGQKDWYTAIANQSGNVFTAQYDKVKP